MTTSTSGATDDSPLARAIITVRRYFDWRQPAVICASQHAKSARIEQPANVPHDDPARDKDVIGEGIVRPANMQRPRPGDFPLRFAPAFVANASTLHMGKATIDDDKTRTGRLCAQQ